GRTQSRGTRAALRLGSEAQRRRTAAWRGGVPPLLLLARRLPLPAGRDRRGTIALRTPLEPALAAGPARGGVRPCLPSPAGKLPAGVFARRAREFGLQPFRPPPPG